MSAIRRTLGILAVLGLAASPAARADEPPLDPALARCTGEVGERLRFLEGRLEDERRYANLWSKGWNAVYASGLVVQGTRAGFEESQGERADLIVAAVKSSIGLARGLWAPPPARLGASELATLPGDGPAACAERLAEAERLLRRNADEARSERRGWLPHAANLALNLAGAVVVAQGFDESDGWVSGAIGFAVGEARIWSYPWRAEGALAAYERRFPASGVPREAPATWHFEPWGAGARVTLRY